MGGARGGGLWAPLRPRTRRAAWGELGASSRPPRERGVPGLLCAKGQRAHPREPSCSSRCKLCMRPAGIRVSSRIPGAQPEGRLRPCRGGRMSVPRGRSPAAGFAEGGVGAVMGSSAAPVLRAPARQALPSSDITIPCATAGITGVGACLSVESPVLVGDLLECFPKVVFKKKKKVKT